jgi:putative addiction module CopG family antidote
MTIELSPELEQLVEEQVKAGRFASTSAAVNAAVELMLSEEHVKKLADLRVLIDEGLADIEAGRFVNDFNLQDFLAARRREHDAKHGS